MRGSDVVSTLTSSSVMLQGPSNTGGDSSTLTIVTKTRVVPVSDGCPMSLAKRVRSYDDIRSKSVVVTVESKPDTGSTEKVPS